MQRSQGFQVKRVQEVGNKAGSQAKSRAVNRGTSWSPEFDAIIKYFREDLLIPTTVVSKNMWKREKIGSTIRIGPDNILPFIKIDKESMNKIKHWMKGLYAWGKSLNTWFAYNFT